MSVIPSLHKFVGSQSSCEPVLSNENSSYEVLMVCSQMEVIFTYTPGAFGVGSLVITVPDASSILAGSPIVLVVTNYAPTSNVDIGT